MAVFSYVARDALGKVVKSTMEAESEQVLVRRLHERGFTVQRINQTRQAGEAAAQPAKPTKGGFWIFGRVKGRDLAIFCRQFATMINAGVSLVRCLGVLEEQTTSLRLRQIIREVTSSVEAGETLSRALSKYPRVFTELFVGLVRAGEVGGVLDESLNRLAGFLEEDQKLRRRVRSSMTYPVLVMIFAIGIVIFLVSFIVPKFVDLFVQLGVKDMPWMTQVLIDFSNLVTKRWYLLIGVTVLAAAAFGRYFRTKIGKRHLDWIKLKLPVFGKLNHKIAIARFSRTLATLLVSGVPILQALETVAGAIDNDIIADAVMATRAAIREGERIGDPLQKSGLFPPMVVQMIAIGEETGSLDAMLSKIADFYDSEVEATLASLTAALEPVMIVMLGGVVLFIVLAMFQPLIAIISQLSGGGE